MKLAFSSNAYTNFSLINSIVDTAKIGYKGIEIMCDHPHAFPLPLDPTKIIEIKNELTNNDIQISNLNAFTLFGIGDTYHPSWIEENSDYRKIRIAHTIECLKLANQLGAKNISIEPGGPMENPNSKEKYLNIFIDGIREVLPFAEKQKVKILVEPEPGLLLETSNDFIQFINNFDSEYIGLNFDIGHFVCVDEDPSQLVFELENYIQHFHLADIKSKIHNHLIPGLGSINFKKIINSIIEIGFDGFITVELYPYKDNPSQAALKSFKYLNEILRINYL
jgi:sugar phosphate isomerase/epimerase